MRIAIALFGLLSTVAAAAEISSEYTEIDPEKDCAVFASAPKGEGDWRSMVCPGWRGYPVILQYDDMRESAFYGFPPAGEGEPPWESFDAFNRAAPRIEWRIATDGEIRTPFAVIQRWFVADPDNTEKEIEVLVVEKVGKLTERDGCAIGYVVATENPNANDKARLIADEQALDFACGADQPVIDAGEVALPSFNRSGEE